MNKIGILLVDYITKKNKERNLSYDVVVFGVTLGLEFFVFITLSLAIAVKLKMTVEYILFLVVFIALRSYAGGFHMKTYKKCLAVSCFIIWCALSIAKKFILPTEIAIFVIGIISWRLYYMGPVGCSTKQLEKAERLVYAKKLQCILIILLAVTVIFCFCNMKAFLTIIALSISVVGFSSEIQRYLNR